MGRRCLFSRRRFPLDDCFHTVKAEAVGEYAEKRSRFIAAVCPAADEQEASAFIEKSRAAHRDARHNVFAFSLRTGARRYCDDGEPSGTAGAPILDLLEKRGITNCAVVVTRYFGGILLGTGGLVRAYSAAAALALDRAGTVKMTARQRCTVVCDYALYNRLASLFPRFGVKVENSDFAGEVTLCLHLPEQGFPSFSKAVRELSGGTCQPAAKDRFYAPTP